MKKPTSLILMATSFVLLTGWYGRCGRDLTVEEKKTRIQRHSTSMLDDVMDDVDATDAQRAQAHAIRQRILKQGLPMLDEQEKAKVFYHQQWASSSPDRARIHEVVDERTEALRKLFHVAADGLVDLHQLLTPEQRKEIHEMWD